MRNAGLWTLSTSLTVFVMLAGPGYAQTLTEPSALSLRGEGTEAPPPPLDHWEFSIGGLIGAPVGHLQVGEFHNGAGDPGTRLTLGALGIHLSEAVEVGAAFHFTADDALRVSGLYYFLRGDSTPGRSIVYNGEEFKPGALHTEADFWRLDVAYERALWRSPVDELVGSIGLAFVYFNPTLTGHGHSNSEDFYLQELPVPIVGLRWSHALGGNWLLRLGASGGGLPQIDSGRQEDGTVHLTQAHADADAGLIYRWGKATELEVGYHFTYFFQHEKSHEDVNDFELIDNGLRVRFNMRF